MSQITLKIKPWCTYYSTISCDQIGRFWKFLVTYLCCKSSPNVWWLLEPLWKHHLKVKNAVVTFTITFWKTLGYFLFQYLVTLELVTTCFFISFFSIDAVQCDQMALLFVQFCAIYDNRKLVIWKRFCHSRLKIVPNTK